MSKLQNLRNLLSQLPSGPLIEVGRIERLLFESWNELAGNDSGGMEAYKLLNRTENMNWKPPVLEFQIERHGSTAMGSVYAGVQTWSVDVQKAVAQLGNREKRCLIGKRAKGLKAGPIAADIEALIVARKEDPRLKWLSETCVRIDISKVIPTTNKQTTSSRRKRFKKALDERLEVAGWHVVPGKLNTFAL